MKKKYFKLVSILVSIGIMLITGCASTKDDVFMEKSSVPVDNAKELTRVMGNGINLGNTMEAYGRAKYGTTGSVSEYETAWGQPVTTQNIVTAFKNAGFDSLRVPVAWTNMMNYEKGDYTINAAYLNRVEEIINYALNVNMYVIINDHWDGSWWGMFGSASEETRKSAMNMYVSLWTQIAEKYKDYSNYLIFESANEELGTRLNDKDVAADSGTLSEDECYATTNNINQTFVNTIRKSGGNNTDRFLLIAGYNTDIDKTCDNRFKMPLDTAENKLLVSVHYYTPSDYCITTSINHWGSKDDYTLMNEQLKKMTKFTEKGYGVIIGEYGISLTKEGSVKNNTKDYIENLLNNSDLYGYCPMLWDCSSLFKRTSLSFVDKDIAALYRGHSFSKQSKKSVKEIKDSAVKALNTALAAAGNAKNLSSDEAIAWLMYSSGDYSISYSVGDKYNPSSKSDGVVATDPAVTGPGTYTVALDFTGTKAGTATGVSFSALGIANGEKLFPEYKITVKEILINGKPYEISGKPYTTSDDGLCTRVNLYNGWVNEIPSKARVSDGDRTGLSACLLNKDTLGKIKTISIIFDYSE